MMPVPHGDERCGTDDCPTCYPVLMTRAEYEAAWRQRAEAAGLRWRHGNEYALPECGRVELRHTQVDTRQGWCLTAWVSLLSVRWEAIPALGRLHAACADLPTYYGHERHVPVAPLEPYVPARGGFGSGAIDDTSGT